MTRQSLSWCVVALRTSLRSMYGGGGNGKRGVAVEVVGGGLRWGGAGTNPHFVWGLAAQATHH